MKKIITSLVLTIVAVMLLGFIACDMGVEATGTLHLNIAQRISRSTLVPDIDMDVATYVVSGTGPGSASFGPTETSQETLIVTNLAIGLWTIEVLAKNEAGTTIGRGENIVTILPNQTGQVTIEVYQNDGLGSLEIFASWPVAALTDPIVTGQLVS